MKKILLFTLFSCLSFAQNPELFSNSWYISQIVMNGQTTTTPTTGPVSPSNFNSIGNNMYVFNSSYYNTASPNITFSSTSDSFTKNSTICTLAVYYGVNEAEVQSFDGKNCSFYMSPGNGHVFNYEIINNANSKTLIITNPVNGNKIYYNNSFLSTAENINKKTFVIYPNPTKQMLNVEEIEKNLSVKIYEMTGKLLYETLSDDKNIQIDVSGFQNGQYILVVENFKPHIFIKE